MECVAIIGNAAGGKSTLARRLSAALGIPWFPVDEWQWRAGWIPAPPGAFDAAHENALSKPCWIIDGWGPASSLEQRLLAADTIIWVDLPLFVHLRWAVKRQVKSLFGFDLDHVCFGRRPWRVTGRMFRMIFLIHRSRDSLRVLIEESARTGNARIVHLTTARALGEYTQRIDADLLREPGRLPGGRDQAPEAT